MAAGEKQRQSISTVKTRNKVSTALFAILALIALVVLIGLTAIAVQLGNVEGKISTLRDRALPQLIKLSQLSQEASASIAIAPALSTNPSRFEFETLLSRIEDKKGSQTSLLQELRTLIRDEAAIRSLQRNSKALAENQTALTSVVRQQIGVRKRLEKHIEALRRMARKIENEKGQTEKTDAATRQTHIAILRLLSVILDPKQARFSRNRRAIAAEIAKLNQLVEFENRLFGSQPETAGQGSAGVKGAAERFLEYWSSQRDRILEDKSAGLTNEFKIKALVEENSLIANRLLSSANAEFWRANEQLSKQVKLIASATRFNLIAMICVVLAFAAAALFLWLTLQKRFFRRLDNMREGLRHYTETRGHTLSDSVPDEIGEISRALSDYMATIDEHERELADKTRDLETLSARLAKYLSPQVYESIFTGKQQVAVASTRKKLTVFFSDIVGFTELSDQLESEELTKLLNEYLTEMSRIALDHGATIDKYVGDAIMVFFGDPETMGVKEDALRCVEMAIAMKHRLTELNVIWRHAGVGKPLAHRTGIHTGFCTVGNFGSEERMDYTIIGGTVNTASRLESVAKPNQILISYETYAHVCDEIECEEHGQIEVKGIAYPVTAYSVVGQRKSTMHPDANLHEVRAGLSLKIDKNVMSIKDRQIALDALQKAIKLLKQ